MEECLAIRRKQGDLRALAMVYNNLSSAVRALGDQERALTLQEESVALARDLGDRQHLAVSLSALYIEAIHLCREVDEMLVATYAVQGLALLAKGKNQPERAIRLIGCVQAQRDRLGVVLPPEDQSGIDRALDHLRETVGESRFEQEWQAGRDLDMETVFTEALAPPS
jgi:hypothetical protein